MFAMEQAKEAERVLIVDDEPVMLDALSRFLRRAGFEVVEASSVVGALDELMAAARKNMPFDHAVVDLLLQDGDGEDVVRACESLASRPNIVVLSGNLDSRRAFDLFGRCLYLPKPVAATTLVEALERRRDPIGTFVEQHGLSTREREALVAAVHGFGNEEAAEKLGVSKEALRKRWRHICEKTGCSGQQRVLAKIIRELSEDRGSSSGTYPAVAHARSDGTTVRPQSQTHPQAARGRRARM
ncbi:MAG TPA: response regulator [Polyangiaceae bacterium]|jgi:two-component system response regulator RegA|nr:response regulator [Polyangiaceae bacterium]